MKCYGKYSKNKSECLDCDKQNYCKDSVYKPKNTVDFSNLENYEVFSSHQTAYDALVTKENELKSFKKTKKKVANIIDELLTEASGDDVQAILFVLIPIFQKLYKYDPRTLRIVLNKMKNPSKSYRQIAIEEKTSKQVVNYHVNKAKEIEPMLDKSLLIDRRYIPYHVPKEYNTTFKMCTMQFEPEVEQLAFDF